MKDERFPWTDAGSGPEPRLPSGFASGAIEKARTIRAGKRRARIELGAAAGFVALLAAFLWMRTTPANQSQQASPSGAASYAITDLESDTWSADLGTVLMPNARQAAKFDSYYGTAGWDTYASWDPDSYDSSRTR